MPSPVLDGYRTLARTSTADCPVSLHQRGRQYAITACRRVLMTSDETTSERALGRVAGSLLAGIPQPRVLVGGLGMGFTLRALLNRLPADARVVVAELLPAVAEWNRARLGHIAGHPLRDARVRLRVTDVVRVVAGPRRWDAILLDVDNGPDWMVQRRNQALYGPMGLHRFLRVLRPGGFLAVWSADRHGAFERRLTAVGVPWQRLRCLSQMGGPGAVLYVVWRG